MVSVFKVAKKTPMCTMFWCMLKGPQGYRYICSLHLGHLITQVQLQCMKHQFIIERHNTDAVPYRLVNLLYVAFSCLHNVYLPWVPHLGTSGYADFWFIVCGLLNSSKKGPSLFLFRHSMACWWMVSLTGPAGCLKWRTKPFSTRYSNKAVNASALQYLKVGGVWRVA